VFHCVEKIIDQEISQRRKEKNVERIRSEIRSRKVERERKKYKKKSVNVFVLRSKKKEFLRH
jgi:hypothetical protein